MKKIQSILPDGCAFICYLESTDWIIVPGEKCSEGTYMTCTSYLMRVHVQTQRKVNGEARGAKRAK
jgi:hypothetical protein